MATPLADVIAFAEEAMGGSSGLPGVADTDKYVARALLRLDDVRPRIADLTIDGDDGDEYTLASPWEQHFSVILRAWHFASGGHDEPGEDVNPESWVIEPTSSGTDQIRLVDWSLATGDDLVLRVTARHTLATATTTIATGDLPFVADLAAALKLEACAIAALRVVDQSPATELGDLNSSDRASKFSRHAAMLRKRFDDHFGVTADGETTASAYVDVDSPVDETVRYAHTHAWRTH